MLVFKHHRRNNGQSYGRRPISDDEEEEVEENEKLQAVGSGLKCKLLAKHRADGESNRSEEDSVKRIKTGSRNSFSSLTV